MGGSNQARSAEEIVLKFINDISQAFDRDPEATRCAENERTRLREALMGVHDFVAYLVGR
jgi:hypothetical protein